jgi:hypothetical protein
MSFTMKNLLFVCVFAAMFTGCASVSRQEAQNASYGARPTAEQYTAAVKATIRGRLNEPDSAEFYFPHAAFKGWYRPQAGDTHFGYWTCGMVNAKNSSGAFTGYDYFVVVYNNGQVTYSNVVSSADDPDFTRAHCQESIEYLSKAPSDSDIPLG